MTDMPTPAASSRRWKRRHFLQFSLGGLLLAMMAFGIWLGLLTNAANRQRRAVAVLERHGGSIEFGERVVGPDGDSVSYAHEPRGPAWLRAWVGEDFFRTARAVSFHNAPFTEEIGKQIAELTELQGISLVRCQLDEDDMRHLAGLRRLESVLLQDNEITDGGMCYLAGATNLETLSLTKNRLTGAGFANLKDMKKLRKLFLYDNPISDEGAKHIADIPNLEMLGLARTKITDAGLTYLASLKNLKYVSLNELKLSHEAVRRLKAALPNCKVEYFGP